MATMFPAKIESFSTPGERQTYHFLQKAARPDSAFIAWYAPDIEAREPDFLLFSPDSGLIVLEVKDWLLDQIIEADPKHFRLRIAGKEECRKNPLAQAKEYVHALLSLLKKNVPRTPDGKALLPVPISCCVVFPHITRDEFGKSGLAKVISCEQVICWDELQDHSPLITDPSGQTFRRWMAERFPPLFSFSLSPKQLDWLRGTIFPVARLDLPRRAGTSLDQAKTIQTFDQDQENLARTFGPGKRLIIGPPGSGKTLILAHQACQLPRMNKKIKRVLITCFNLTLKGYIKRLLACKGASLGPDHIEVVPFYDLCERFLGERLAHSQESSEYYQIIVQEALERLDGSHPLQSKWDAIFVDEGQDFSSHMAQVLLRLLPKYGTLTVAQDDNQRIYPNTGGWENMGIDDLHIHRLHRQYRSTRPIARLAAMLLDELIAPETFVGVEGPDPKWIAENTVPNLITKISEEIFNKVQAGIPMNEIAILYVNTKTNAKKNLPTEIINALESRGILSTWITYDTRSKRNFDITKDTVTISTIYSAKGLDFSHVIIVDSESLLENNEWSKRLRYVAITRARENLTFATYKES